VRTEQVPWARPGARHTRDFEDAAAWLVRRMPKAAVATLLQTPWNMVDGLVRRLVTAHLNPKEASHRLTRPARIGVDEIAYRKGRKFLTIVTDHIVWVRKGRTQTALIAFLDTLGPAGRERIRAISMDMTRIYREAARIHLPQAAICYDPFHLIKWVGTALDQVHLAIPHDSAQRSRRSAEPVHRHRAALHHRESSRPGAPLRHRGWTWHQRARHGRADRGGPAVDPRPGPRPGGSAAKGVRAVAR
jgi:transposase